MENAILEQEKLIFNLILSEQDIADHLRAVTEQKRVLEEQLQAVTESLRLAKLRKLALEMADRARNQPDWKKGTLCFFQQPLKESLPKLD